MFKHNKAFTMSEVLIVLAIIGVTSAIVLPSLNSDVNERKIVSALRKSYSELSAVYQSIVETYGKPASWNVASNTTSAVMTNRMGGYFNEMASVAKDCGTAVNTGCFSSANEPNATWRKFLMKDGSSVAIYLFSMEDMQESLETLGEYRCGGDMGTLKVDVNGPRGENQDGYDTFYFDICYDKGLRPEDVYGLPNPSIDYAASWVLQAGNRDYLKCNNLNWNTKRTCD